MDSVSELIGIPYEKADCWAIAQLYYKKVLGIELKNYYDTVPDSRDKARDLVVASMKDFFEVQSPRRGDLVLIRMFNIESHIAVYLGEGAILHTTEQTGSVVDRFARWEKRAVGYYRVKPND